MASTTVTKRTNAVQSAVRINIGLLLVLAAFPLLAPNLLLRGFGITDASFAVMGLVRIFAVLALLLAVVVWGAREWLESPSAQSTVGALAGAYALGALLLFTQQWAVWDGRSGVGLMLGCAVLAVSYGRALGQSRAIGAPVA